MNLFYILCGSLVQSSVCAFLSVVCAFPLMHMVQSFSRSVRSLFYSLFLMLVIMPSTVAAMSVSSFYFSPGMIAVTLAHLLLNIPLVFHILYWDFARVNVTLYFVARCLGAGKFRSYYDGILLPLFPSLIDAFLIVFILCFSSVSIPLLLGTSEWSNTLDSIISLLYKTGATKSICICILLRTAVVLVVVFMSHRLKTGRYISYKTEPLYDKMSTPVKGWVVVGCGIMLALLLPIISLCTRFVAGLSTYQQKISAILSESLIHIITRSFFIAVSSGTISIILALIFLYKKHRYAALFSSIPWLIGGTACAVLCKLIAFYIPLPPLVLVVLCHVLLCLPFVVRMITVALHQYNKEWTLYARSCGATDWQIFMALKLPYLREALCAAWSLSLGLSLAQVGVAQLLVDSTGITLPVAVRMLKANGLMDGAIVLSACSMMLTFIPSFLVYLVIARWQSSWSAPSLVWFSGKSRGGRQRKRLQHSV